MGNLPVQYPVPLPLSAAAGAAQEAAAAGLTTLVNYCLLVVRIRVSIIAIKSYNTVLSLHHTKPKEIKAAAAAAAAQTHIRQVVGGALRLCT